MSDLYEVELIYTFEKPGVLLNADDEASVIPKIDPAILPENESIAENICGNDPKIRQCICCIK